MYCPNTHFLFTGTRAFKDVTSVEFWHTDTQACLYQGEDRSRRVVLDEEETHLVRRWAELALQTAIADNEDLVLRSRCDRLEQLRRARKMNETRGLHRVK